MGTNRKKILIPIIAAFAAAAIGAAVLITFSLNGRKSFEDTLPVDSVLSAEQALNDLDYIYRTISENHPCFLDGSGLDKELSDEYNRQRSIISGGADRAVDTLYELAAKGDV